MLKMNWKMERDSSRLESLIKSSRNLTQIEKGGGNPYLLNNWLVMSEKKLEIDQEMNA